MILNESQAWMWQNIPEKWSYLGHVFFEPYQSEVLDEVIDAKGIEVENDRPREAETHEIL